MDYKELGLSKVDTKTSFDWNGKKVFVNGFLPVDAKYDIVMITLQKAFENGIYNPIKLDVFFHLNLVYMYTDIEFSVEDREDEFKLYDEMRTTGFMDEFLKHINPNEYQEMQEDIDNISELRFAYNTTAASILRDFIEDLPANAEAAAQIVENFDPDKYQAVVDFAKAANGGRDIK